MCSSLPCFVSSRAQGLLPPPSETTLHDALTLSHHKLARPLSHHMVKATYSQEPVSSINVDMLTDSCFLVRSMRRYAYRDAAGRVNLHLLRLAKLEIDGQPDAQDSVREKLVMWLRHVERWAQRTLQESGASAQTVHGAAFEAAGSCGAANTPGDAASSSDSPLVASLAPADPVAADTPAEPPAETELAVISRGSSSPCRAALPCARAADAVPLPPQSPAAARVLGGGRPVDDLCRSPNPCSPAPSTPNPSTPSRALHNGLPVGVLAPATSPSPSTPSRSLRVQLSEERKAKRAEKPFLQPVVTPGAAARARKRRISAAAKGHAGQRPYQQKTTPSSGTRTPRGARASTASSFFRKDHSAPAPPPPPPQTPSTPPEQAPRQPPRPLPPPPPPPQSPQSPPPPPQPPPPPTQLIPLQPAVVADAAASAAALGASFAPLNQAGGASPAAPPAAAPSPCGSSYAASKLKVQSAPPHALQPHCRPLATLCAPFPSAASLRPRCAPSAPPPSAPSAGGPRFRR